MVQVQIRNKKTGEIKTVGKWALDPKQLAAMPEYELADPSQAAQNGADILSEQVKGKLKKSPAAAVNDQDIVDDIEDKPEPVELVNPLEEETEEAVVLTDEQKQVAEILRLHKEGKSNGEIGKAVNLHHKKVESIITKNKA